jgi:hypothetical protein
MHMDFQAQNPVIRRMLAGMFLTILFEPVGCRFAAELD